MGFYLQKSLFFYLLVLHNILTILVRTGPGNIYNVKQQVSLGYVSIPEENINLYYQYFKSLVKAKRDGGKKNIILYLGQYLGKSSQPSSYLGIYPYEIFQDDQETTRFKVKHIENNLNSICDVVGLDLVRGSGFSINQSSKTLTYDVIIQDLDNFISKFLDLENLKEEDLNITIMASYEMAVPAIKYSQTFDRKVNLILENPWFGYSAISQTSFTLPVYGHTERKSLNLISNVIYSLQNSDYGKDFEEMYSQIKVVQEILSKRTPIDCNNPLRSQDEVYQIIGSVKGFFKDCGTCKAYCSIEKSEFGKNETIYNALQKDFIFDYSMDFFDQLSKVKGKVLILQGKNNLKTSLEPILENASSKDIFGSKDFNNKITVRIIDNAGFYPLKDSYEDVIKYIKRFIQIENN